MGEGGQASCYPLHRSPQLREETAGRAPFLAPDLPHQQSFGLVLNLLLVPPALR